MSLTIFMYHRIFPDARKEAISLDAFRSQLDYIQKHYTLLAPSDVERYVSGELKIKRDCAALSFDDAWVDNLLFATDELKKRGLSSFLAVSASCLHDCQVRTEVADDVLYRSMAEAQKLSREGDKLSYCSREELSFMQASGVWQLEVHGTRHELGDGGTSVLAYPQNGMDEEKFKAFLKDDLLNAKEELSKITGRKHHTLFWPWGHYTNLSLEIARECGFDVQFTVAKGSIKSGDKRLVLPRVGVPPRWKKFVKNCFVFRHAVLAAIHDCFHKEKVCFNDRMQGK